MAEYIRRGKVGEPKVAREPSNGWTKARRETFLNHLAATCNVIASCEATGMRVSGLYALRRRDMEFAEQWRAALLTGYDTLEARLLEHALGALDQVEHGEVAVEPFDPEIAIRILNMHHAKLKGSTQGGARGGARVKRATEEETNAAIMKQLAVLDRRLAAEKARKAEAEAAAVRAGKR